MNGDLSRSTIKAHFYLTGWLNVCENIALRDSNRKKSFRLKISQNWWFQISILQSILFNLQPNLSNDTKRLSCNIKYVFEMRERLSICSNKCRLSYKSSPKVGGPIGEPIIIHFQHHVTHCMDAAFAIVIYCRSAIDSSQLRSVSKFWFTHAICGLGVYHRAFFGTLGSAMLFEIDS